MPEQDRQSLQAETPDAAGRTPEGLLAGAEASPPLGRAAPLVPVDSAASRALVGVIAILTFVAALCAATAERVASRSAEWRTSVSREATIQVRPNPKTDIEADVTRAAAIARATAGVDDVRIMSKADAARLLEPWLGAGLDMTELPTPRLITLRLGDKASLDVASLKAALSERVPGAAYDDHNAWLSRLGTMAGAIVGVGIGLMLLVLLATALAVTFATRGAMAGNREIVEVLHLVGASDGFIAREFGRRFFRLGLKGSLLGAAAALALVAAFGAMFASWSVDPDGHDTQALFGAIEADWRGYSLIVVIALLVAGTAGMVSRLTVRRFLSSNA